MGAMQLKRATDILLRILIYLASRRQSEPVSIHDLSEALNWNKNLVVKVTHFAVQEGLLTLWEKKDTFDPSRGPFDRWASTVLYNRFIDIIRHDTFKKKTETHINDIADRLDEISLKRQVSDSSNPEVFFDFYVALAEAFRKEKSRSVRIGLAGIWNSFTGRFTSDELAESLGINKVLLNSCISRARARFRPYLADYYS